MRILFFLLLFLLSQNTNAQNGQSVGIHLGIPIINEKLSEGYEYQPWQLLFYWNFANLMKGKKNDLFIYLEPQLVWVHFSDKSKKKAFEFGANLGFEYRYNFNDKTALIASLGSGPHYISEETASQRGGFIFSDNFGTLGLKQSVGDSGTDLHLRARYRHISNANLKLPNKGIDNWFLIFGATKDI